MAARPPTPDSHLASPNPLGRATSSLHPNSTAFASPATADYPYAESQQLRDESTTAGDSDVEWHGLGLSC